MHVASLVIGIVANICMPVNPSVCVGHKSFGTMDIFVVKLSVVIDCYRLINDVILV